MQPRSAMDPTDNNFFLRPGTYKTLCTLFIVPEGNVKFTEPQPVVE